MTSEEENILRTAGTGLTAYGTISRLTAMRRRMNGLKVTGSAQTASGNIKPAENGIRIPKAGGTVIPPDGMRRMRQLK